MCGKSASLMSRWSGYSDPAQGSDARGSASMPARNTGCPLQVGAVPGNSLVNLSRPAVPALC